MDLNLRSKRALVCASSQGLGRAIAQGLAAEGVDLFLCSRSEDKLASVADQIRSQHGVKVVTKAIDLSATTQLPSLAEAAQKELGGIDILINNCGGPPPCKAMEVTQDQWQQGFEKLFLSTTQLTSALIGPMSQRQFGRIITVTSLSVSEPIANLAISTAMRAAVTGWSKTLASEVASSGVTVHTVMPGVIHTARTEELRRAKDPDGDVKRALAETAKAIPAQRLGRPEEMADLVTFLCSPRASYMTGLNLTVDGGLRKSCPS